MRRLRLLAFAGILGLLAATSTAGATSAATIEMSISSPLYAGAVDATVTVSGVADPGSYLQPWVNLKQAGATCAADPAADNGDEIGPADQDYADDDGSYSFAGPWDGASADTAGATFVVCAWLLEDGVVAAQTQQTVTVAKPPVTLSLSDVPAKLPARELGETSLGTLHADVGPTSRSVDWFVQPASQPCAAANPRQGGNPAATVSGEDTVDLTVDSTGEDGRNVVCVYVGDQSGKEVDGLVASSVIVVGRGFACVVPSLVGKTVKAAAAAVSRAGCLEGALRYVKGSRAKRGRVVRQAPAPGTGLGPDAKVSITVGR
jgi:PASTA domain